MAAFASCGGGADTVAQDADINAKVEAKVATTKEQLKADCDARVVLAGQLRADSISASKTRTVAPPVVAAAPVVAAPVAARQAAPTPKPAPAPKAKPAPNPVVKTIPQPQMKPKTEAEKVKDRFKANTPKEEAQKVKDRFKAPDVKAETKKVEDRFGNKPDVKATEQKVREEEKKVLNRFGK